MAMPTEMLPPVCDYTAAYTASARRADGGYELPLASGLTIGKKDPWRRLKLSLVDGDVFMIEFVCDANWYVEPAAAPRLEPSQPPCTRIEHPQLPHTLEIRQLLSQAECEQIVRLSEAIGYDRPESGGGVGSSLASTGRRPPDRFVWVTDTDFSEAVFARCADLLPPSINGWTPRGINPRWRLYRYEPGFALDRHLDRSYTSSGLHSDGRLRNDLLQDGSKSLLTLLIYLNDKDVGTAGGGTTLYTFPDEATGTYAEVVTVTPTTGDALAFPHGVDNPEAVWHAGDPLTAGVKHIIRTDVIYTPPPPEPPSSRDEVVEAEIEEEVWFPRPALATPASVKVGRTTAILGLQLLQAAFDRCEATRSWDDAELRRSISWAGRSGTVLELDEDGTVLVRLSVHGTCGATLVPPLPPLPPPDGIAELVEYRATELAAAAEEESGLPGAVIGLVPGAEVIVVSQQAAAGIGWHIWPAALMMCRWLAAAQSNGALSALLAPAGVQVGGCVVLEMGAGIGLGGVWASALGIGRPENGVVLTDLPAVLPNLRATVAANPVLAGRLAVLPLAWGDAGHEARFVAPTPGDAAGFFIKPDLVLCADCVYHEHLFAPLASTLGRLCAANPGLVVVMAQQRRFKREEAFFKKHLPKAGLCVQKLSESVSRNEDGARVVQRMLLIRAKQ